jgi:hypothetical protein
MVGPRMACRHRPGHLVKASSRSGADGSARDRDARSSDAYIAYRIMGSGPVDLVLLQGGFSHVELQLEEPSFARFLGRLASFSRLIVLDVRGTGLSDRTIHLPTLEDQVDDVLAVLDAAGCERPAFRPGPGRGPGQPVRGGAPGHLRTETPGSAGRTVLSLRVTLGSDQRPSRL